MTTERTPQDVLRELRREIAELAISHPGDTDDLAYNNALRRVLDLLDKAIAEAPDSPPSGFVVTDPEWDAPDGARVLFERIRGRWEPIEKAPDTLSEKPGLDVERIAQVWANVMDGRRIGSGLNAARIGRTTTTDEDWQAIAAEYTRLGSTDSEGR